MHTIIRAEGLPPFFKWIVYLFNSFHRMNTSLVPFWFRYRNPLSYDKILIDFHSQNVYVYQSIKLPNESQHNQNHSVWSSFLLFRSTIFQPHFV